MNESKPDVNKVLFMHLVSMLAMSAIQQMGKLVNPGTGKAEINLEAAQATIDMLDMLAARTQGNLDAEETRLLKDTLMSLKMNYVESKDRNQKSEVRSQRSDGPEKQTHNPSADGPNTESKKKNETQETSNTEGKKPEDGTPAGGARDEKSPKYHKKYE